MRARLALPAATAVLLFMHLWACGDDISHPSLAISLQPRVLSSPDSIVKVTIEARTSEQRAGSGTIHLSSQAGAFDNATLSLDEKGLARATYQCDSRHDVRCSGTLWVQARWEDANVEEVTVVIVDGPALADGSVPEIDSGMDAGSEDAAVPDGSVEPTDAGGSDAGEVDAGDVDAGSQDAGEPDAGEPDAGVVDGGEMDAGTPDASIDSGVPDAGTADAGSFDAGAPPPFDGGFPDSAGLYPFDPKTLVLFGTVQEGASGRNALCDVGESHVAYTGFRSNIDPAYAPGKMMIHPIDGTVHYVFDTGSSLQLRRFNPDVVYQGDAGSYPLMPEVNDVVVATPGCGSSGIDRYLIRPDGSVVHRCSGSPTWLDANGAAIATCANVVAFSEDGASYCAATPPSGASVRDSAGIQHPVSGAPTLFVVRSRPGGGFWGVARSANNQTFERWFISSSGAVVLEGTYPVHPGFIPVNADVPAWGNIDAFGNFYRWGYLGPGLVDTVVRFAWNFSSSSVVYEEDVAGTVCRFHGSQLISGP